MPRLAAIVHCNRRCVKCLLIGASIIALLLLITEHYNGSNNDATESGGGVGFGDRTDRESESDDAAAAQVNAEPEAAARHRQPQQLLHPVVPSSRLAKTRERKRTNSSKAQTPSENSEPLDWRRANAPTNASGRRSCSPPKFLSYDELEALVNATGGAARGRLVHHSWKTPALPPRFWRYSSTWCECFNAWPQVLWTDEDNARFVRDKFAWFYDVFREFAYPINRLDTLRYLYLAEYGGLYTDLDNLCLRPFEHLLHGYGIVYGDMAAGQYQNRPFHFVQNSYAPSLSISLSLKLF